MSATCSVLDVVGLAEWNGGVCRCTPAVYHSDADLLCRKLFGEIPVGINAECQLPDVEIFKDGVSTEDEIKIDGELHEYTFTIETESGREPRKSDVVMYDGRFYVIGKVETIEDPYLEIDPEVLWVFPNLESMNHVYSNLAWNIN